MCAGLARAGPYTEGCGGVTRVDELLLEDTSSVAGFEVAVCVANGGLVVGLPPAHASLIVRRLIGAELTGFVA